MPPAISVRKLGYSYRQGFWLKRKTVLRDLSFDVQGGSCFGLIGANGAGKTTLIRLLAGIADPEGGEVLIRGVPANRPEARRMIGFLPERPYFHGFLTGREFLETMASLSGVRRSERPRAIARALERVSLEHAAGQRLSSYSKGMLQRIGIAQAILHDPPILILDEPMSGLDPLWRRNQRELIGGICAEGRTVIFSSHSLEDVERLCDRAGMIRDGSLIPRGSREWSTPAFEIFVSGIGNADPADMSLGTGIEISSERNGVKILVPAGMDPTVIVERIVRSGASVRSVQPAPIEWETPHAGP